MTKQLRRGVLSLCTVVLTAMCAQTYATPESVLHANWCFYATSNSKLFEKPLDKGTCSALLTGGLLAAYFTNRPELADLVLSARENELARAAAKLACLPGPLNNQYAIRLIQVCQCHNMDAQRSVENNQTEVLAELRAHGKCSASEALVQPKADAPSPGSTEDPPAPPVDGWDFTASAQDEAGFPALPAEIPTADVESEEVHRRSADGQPSSFRPD